MPLFVGADEFADVVADAAVLAAGDLAVDELFNVFRDAHGYDGVGSRASKDG